MWNTAGCKPVFTGSGLSVPRLRLGPVPSRRTLLGGGWWPRSADPVAELPGLIRAIDDRRGRVTRVMLGPEGWDSQPRWLRGAGRAVPLDWFPGQPAGVLTVFCIDDRVNLLVVPPGATAADALGAMDLAAQAVNFIRVPEILATLTSPTRPTETELELSGWESDGGRPASLTDAT
jgi:hypothetical protein